MKRTTTEYVGQEGPRTPWGIADSVTEYAPGITFYSTPSHGGFALSVDRQATLQAMFPGFRTFCGLAGWYEEDCDWAAVALAFPDAFPDINPEEAQGVFDHYCAKRMPVSPNLAREVLHLVHACNATQPPMPEAVKVRLHAAVDQLRKEGQP